MVEEEKVVEVEEVEEVKEEKPVVTPTSEMSEEEMHAEVEAIREQQKKTLKFMILSLAFALGCWLPIPLMLLGAIPYIGILIVLVCFLAVLGLAAASITFTVFRIINAIRLLLKTKDFHDPHGYLNEEDAKFVKNSFVFSIVAIIV